MEINFKNKNELTFLGIGILMVIIVISVLAWAITFLTGSIGSAFDRQGSGVKAVINFQVERAEAILNR